MKTIAQVGMLVALAALAAPVINAELITFQFTGTVDGIETDMCSDTANRVHIGDNLVATYTFDTSVPGWQENPDEMIYEAMTATSLTVGQITAGGASGRFLVKVNSEQHAYVVVGTLGGCGNGDYCTPEWYSIVFDDRTGTMLPDLSLPTTPPAIPSFARFELNVDNTNKRDYVYCTIESLTLFTVPTDVTPPTVVSVAATPSMLWPPNGQMVSVTATAEITDDLSEVASATLIVDDEYNQFRGEFPMTLDATTGLWKATIQLKAARFGADKTDGGRTYLLKVRATDSAGNASVPSTVGATVLVPHSQGKKK